MALFDKFRTVNALLQNLSHAGARPIGVVMDRVISASEALVNGHPTILAGTNNYLGLTFDPDCIAAACRALQEEGTGTTGSRMANGTYGSHRALENELADFFGCRHAIVFSTGYTANLGMLAGLSGPDDTIIIDADCHASIYDGCRLSGAQFLLFKHNDASDLEKRLRRLGDRAKDCLVVVEGIYSMLGDRSALADIAAVKSAYGSYLLVDEAHSLGVLGDRGRGRAEECGVEQDVDFIVGTFSKSLGAIGGFCVSNYPELDLVRYASRPYIFTASPSPSVIASTRAALRILQARPELRARLWDNARRLYYRLQELGCPLGPEPSPIISVRMKSPEEALAAWRKLLEQGVYVNIALPPATPDGNPLLRCSLSAAHTPQQVDGIGDAFASLWPSA